MKYRDSKCSQNKIDNVNKLEKLIPTCYNLETTTRPVASLKGDYWDIKSEPGKHVCSCNPMYYKLDSSNVTHFGNCTHNSLAALLVR